MTGTLLAYSLSREKLQRKEVKSAEKILGLRLRGTDLVVLSACDTGIGEVKSGEGVYGLRRAFIQAGTKGLVMSMWSVLDTDGDRSRLIQNLHLLSCSLEAPGSTFEYSQR